MFKLTPAAAQQVLRAAQEGAMEGMSLRLAAGRKPDGGIDYKMGFDEASEEDIRFKSEGVDIVMEPESAPLLDQCTLDYVALSPGDFQFIFLNPLDPEYVPPGED